jgi:hypothetical protein
LIAAASAEQQLSLFVTDSYLYGNRYNHIGVQQVQLLMRNTTVSLAAGTSFTKDYPDLTKTLATQATARAARLGPTQAALFLAVATEEFLKIHYEPKSGVLLAPTEAQLAAQPAAQLQITGATLFPLWTATARWPGQAFRGKHAFVNETSFGTEKGLVKIFEGFLIGPAAEATTCVSCWPGPGNVASGAS